MIDAYISTVLDVISGNRKIPSYKEIISEIYKRVDKKDLACKPLVSWFHLLKNVFVICACIFILYLFKDSGFFYILLPFLVLFEALCFFGLQSLVHECVHYMFSPRKITNEILGSVLGAIFSIDYNEFKASHRLHHQYSQNEYNSPHPDPKVKVFLGGNDNKQKVFRVIAAFHDKIFQKIPSRFLKGASIFLIISFLGFIFFNAFLDRGPRSLLKTKPKFITRQKTLFFFVWVSLWSSLFFAFGFWFVAFAIILPLVVSAGIESMLFLNHVHRGTMSPITLYNFSLINFNISNIKASSLFNFFGNNFQNYHLEHHMMPNVPHYQLKNVSASLESFAEFTAPARTLDYECLYESLFRYILFVKEDITLKIGESRFSVPSDFLSYRPIFEKYKEFIVSTNIDCVQVFDFIPPRPLEQLEQRKQILKEQHAH